MNQNNPRVSIGIPVYNGEKYLVSAIKSILDQSYSDFELIISDNASVDHTQEICHKYLAQDDRIRYYRNEKNLGAAPNYNRVFELSRGQYFKWSAYDDLISPDFLGRCVEALDNNPDAILCYPRVKLINATGESINRYDPEPDVSSPLPHERFRNLLFTPNLWVYTYGLIRSNEIRKTAKHQSYPSSDEVFLLTLTLQGRFFEIPEYLFYLRIHPEQSTRGDMQVERDRTIWFDTSLEGLIVLPKWLYLFGCLNGIANASINRRERLICYSYMARWLLVPAHLRAMGKDSLLAIRQLFIRAIKYKKKPFGVTING
jgi:glycosyltransferase involved in cell wall biosynthesis